MSTMVALPMVSHSSTYPTHQSAHLHQQSPTHDQPRRHKKMLRDGSGEVWPDHAELLFAKAIQEYDRQSAIASAQSPYPPDLPSRNEFIVKYLHNAGLERTKQQVASHIQQLKKRSTKEAHHSTPSPSFSHRSPSTSIASGSYSDSSAYYASSPAMAAFTPSSSSLHEPTVTSIAIRVNDNPPLQVPQQNLVQVSGAGLTARIRLLVPPHQDPTTHLTTSRIFAIVNLSGSLPPMTTTQMTNKISVNNVFLLDETDSFLIQGNQLYCPLRMSPQSSMLAATQGSGSFPFLVLYSSCLLFHRSPSPNNAGCLPFTEIDIENFV